MSIRLPIIDTVIVLVFFDEYLLLCSTLSTRTFPQLPLTFFPLDPDILSAHGFKCPQYMLFS